MQIADTATSAPPEAIRGRRMWRSIPSGTAVSVGAATFAVALVVYNNVAYSLYHVAFPSAWVLYPRAVIIPALAIAGSLWVFRLSLDEIGLGRNKLASGAAIGLGLAIVAALPVALVLVGIDVLSIDAFSFRNIDRATERGWYPLYWALVLYPVHTVIFEELLFRGVLQGLTTRSFGVVRGIVLTAGTFALWHVAVDYRVLGRAEIADYPVLFFLLQIGVLIAILAGGIVLSLLRARSGSVLAPIAFHWGFLVLLAGTLFAIAL